MESKNEFKKLILKNVRVIILIMQWKLLVLILEVFAQMRNLICDISYKTSLIGTIPLRVKFNKTDEFVKIYD